MEYTTLTRREKAQLKRASRGEATDVDMDLLTCEGDQGHGPCGRYTDWGNGKCSRGHEIEMEIPDEAEP